MKTETKEKVEKSAFVVKLVDTPSWGGGDESRMSSSLIEGTKKFNCWAVVVKLVDTPSWGGGDESRVSSSLTDGTKIQKAWLT